MDKWKFKILWKLCTQQLTKVYIFYEYIVDIVGNILEFYV